MLQACGTINYYQVYEVGTDIKQTNEALVYEDENCDIIYNLWEDAGSMDFVFTNKTDKDIYIDLAQSFFIQNGIAVDYYTDREFTSTTTVGATSTTSLLESYTASAIKGYTKYGYTHTPNLWTPTTVNRGSQISHSITAGSTTSVTSGHSASVTTRAKRYICVPANASKIVRSFGISDYVYMICENNDFNLPKKESEKITYTKEESPLNFRNRITYIIDEINYTVDNQFWVISVQNYKKNSIIKNETVTNCFTKMREEKSYFIISGPNMFYNNYQPPYIYH